MQFDLIIIGGGLAGLSLACGLRETRLKIALIENHPPRPAENWDARIYAVTPANAADVPAAQLAGMQQQLSTAAAEQVAKSYVAELRKHRKIRVVETQL